MMDRRRLNRAMSWRCAALLGGCVLLGVAVLRGLLAQHAYAEVLLPGLIVAGSAVIRSHDYARAIAELEALARSAA